MTRMKPSEVRGWVNAYARFERDAIQFWDQCQRELDATRAALAPAKENLPSQHAYVMLCFGQIDGLSQRWRGGDAWKDKYQAMIQRRIKERKRLNLPRKRYLSAQTRRMVSFMHRYMGVKPATGRIVVEMYRHMLMHEGRVRPILDVRDRFFMWYLTWEADPAHHLHIRQPEMMGDDYLVECAVVNLVADVAQAIRAYASDLQRGPILQREFRRLDNQRWDDLLE